MISDSIVIDFRKRPFVRTNARRVVAKMIDRKGKVGV